MSKIFDNFSPAASFRSGLLDILSNLGVERADFCTGYFNLRGWSLVADQVSALPGGDISEPDPTTGYPKTIHRTVRLLVGMNRAPADLLASFLDPQSRPMDQETATRLRRAALADFRRQLLSGVPTAADEASLRKLSAQLSEGRVAVRLHLRFPLHAKLYLSHRPADTSNPVMSLMGSSNLTFSGLCANGELDAELTDPGDGQKLAKWFEDRWNDRFSLDITADLAKVIDEGWAGLPHPTPWEIYLKIAMHLGAEAIGGASQFSLIPSPFDKELYEFQKTAVQLLLRHLDRRGGAMLGDVVGLGKTWTACAVAKWYEAREGCSTLVLCPPNLVKMWRGYSDRYDLKMMVRSLADRFDPKNQRFFKLVVVDESHNLRNGEGQRYARVRDLLRLQGSHVLLLTATPYNKDFSDIAAQLRLFLDPDADLGVRPSRTIADLGGEQEFSLRWPDVPLSSLRSFEKSEDPDDWRDLLKLYLVRRTRSFIKKNYALADETDPSRRYLVSRQDGSRNYFPDRVPVTVRFPTSPGDSFERMYSEETMDAIGSLKLPRYGLAKYVDPAAAASASPEHKATLDNLSTAGTRLMGFCRTGLVKRMDSSGVAFLMTVYRHAVRNAVFLHAIKNGLDVPLRSGMELDEGWTVDDDGSGSLVYEFPLDPAEYASRGAAEYEELRTGPGSGSIVWLPSRFFKTRPIRDALRADLKVLVDVLARCGAWRGSEDRKLDTLADLVSGRHAFDKVLVFTQFADTARYLRDQLRARSFAHVEEVDGSSPDLLDQVARFSPVSSGVRPVPPASEQTRILVATDTLSEGQNLQDAHVVVNYDLPWALIRLVQRAGRVDRIGQKAPKVFCHSFFPQDGVERVIRLVNRLGERVNANADAVGSDEVFFEGNRQNLVDVFNEKAGILDEADDGEVDLPSQAFQVWNDATRSDPALRARIEGLADAVYCGRARGANAAPGTILLSRAPSGADSLVRTDVQGVPLAHSPSRVFAELACDPDTPGAEPDPAHHARVAAALAAVAADSAAAVATSGVLGAKSSVRYRLFNILGNRLRENRDTLFEGQDRDLSDAVYARPLREAARAELGRMFARGETADTILDRARALHAEDALCAPASSDSRDAATPGSVARALASVDLV